MRFTMSGGKPDFEKAEKEILRALELGVNYFDTAYIYPGSEDTLGRIIEKNNIREKITLTTKLPGQRQLALLQVVYTANAHTIWCEQADNLPLCYFLKLNFGVVRKFTRKLSSLHNHKILGAKLLLFSKTPK